MNTGHGKTTESARKPDKPLGGEMGKTERVEKVAKIRTFEKIAEGVEPNGEKKAEILCFPWVSVSLP